MARCSKLRIILIFIAGVAATCAAPCAAAVRVEGLNAWLSAGAERSLSAVFEHIPAGETNSSKETLLTVVANRLLPGYKVESVTFGESAVSVKLVAVSPPPDWSVSLSAPNLSPPVDAWFASDISDIGGQLSPLMEDVPIEALSWGDADLKRTVEELCKEKLPGWRISLMVRNADSGDALLDVSFVPEQPVTLAVTSNINSSSIPVMLHSSLREDLLVGFAPVIGVPVPWLENHRDDLVQLGAEILKGVDLVEQAKARSEMTVRTGPISEVNVELESKRYAVWVWMAVYAGGGDKFPEAGLHFGRRAEIFPDWDMELYAELIMAMNDWDLETRLGMRWSPWRNFWLGGEWSDLDDSWWARASVDSRSHRPYAWIRFSEDGDANGAVGYRITDFISIEAHYDSRSDDPWNLRALVNM
ncbi:MAG: hypothetical protein LBQ19_03580 [Synergistaceae bacterium]|nr:hypothetical protein [Synergistaceae bacterium]